MAEDDVKSVAMRLAQAVVDLHADVSSRDDEPMKRHVNNMKVDAEKLVGMVKAAPEGSMEAHSPEERRAADDKMRADEMKKQSEDMAKNAQDAQTKADEQKRAAEKAKAERDKQSSAKPEPPPGPGAPIKFQEPKE